MSSISLNAMRPFLSRSIASLNRNESHDRLAEIEFREHLRTLGFADQMSAGGWIARSGGSGTFGHRTVALFPQLIIPGRDYNLLSDPSFRLHTISATFHQTGIHSYYCAPRIRADDDLESIEWHAVQLGLPRQQAYQPFPGAIAGFRARSQRYPFLKYATNVSAIPDEHVPEEFSKEHLRVTFQNQWMSEIVDVDGILWGQQHTYPVEIKEKTAAQSRKMGEFFGLDIGPFVKLAFYAAKRGNLHALFVVREIDDVTTRILKNWWFITFDKLATFAGWNPIGGGMSMTGGSSKVVPIPKAEFSILDAAALSKL